MSIHTYIVTRDADAVVFVEMKTRRDRGVGPPAEAVVAEGRARPRCLAAQWLNGHPTHVEEIRLYVARILRPPSGPALIEHLGAAF